MSGVRDMRQAFESRAQFEAFDYEEDAPSAFTDTVAAAFNLARREELSHSAARAWQQKNEERAKVIGELGGDEALAREYSIMLQDLSWALQLRDDELLGNLHQNPHWANMGDRLHQAFEQQIDFEHRFPDRVLDDQGLLDQFQREAAELRKGETHTLERGGAGAAFLGTAGAVMTDPLVLMTLPFGAEAAAGRTVLQAAGRTAVVEGAIAVATEVPIQMQVAEFKRELESPWSWQASAINVLAAGAGGAVLGGAIGGGMEGGRRLLARYRAAKDAGDVTPTPDMDEAEQALEDTLALHDQNPLEVDSAHEQAFETARAQDAAGQPIDVSRQVEGLEPQDPINDVLRRADDPAELVDLDPTEIAIDARTFQFKGGSDAQGVTDALSGVTRFDRRLAGVAIVWEDQAGQRFIADGHQRVALARRALEAGQDPAEVRLNGFVLREADGVTAADARQIAAVKNLAEGTGTPVDAAKLLRELGPTGETLLPPLPPRSALVRLARGLAQLVEEPFRAVVNDVIDQRFGALIGHATGDGKLQQAMVEIIRKTQPANEVQARSIIDQVKQQGVTVRRTQDLFGEQAVAESLYLERAQVLDAALRAARQDRALFGRLVSESGRIQSAGQNRLDRAANQARVQEATHATTQISSLANAKGPLSDALSAAAERVKAGEKPGAVVGDFLAAARREILESDSRGAQARRARPGDDAAAAAGVIPRAEGLSEPEQAIETRFAERLAADVDQAIDDYSALPTTEGGRILNTDDARELSPDYAADRSLSRAVHEPASWLVKAMYERRLADMEPGGRVIFSAGGTGAGKSSGLQTLDIPDEALIYDTNLGSLDSAAAKIDQALEAGQNVSVVYTYRDPVESLRSGALARAARQEARDGSGRVVPIEEHEKTHRGSRDTVEALMARYGDDSRVAFDVIDNSKGKGQAVVSSLDALPPKAYTDLGGKLDATLEKAHQAGEISEAIYRGFRRQDAAAGERSASRPADRRRTQSPPGETQRRVPDGLVERAPVDAAPRSIVRRATDDHTGTPDATRTGTVPDEEYEAILARAESLIEEQGEFARTAREVDGELETSSLRDSLQSLDRLEETLERVRLCTLPARSAA